MHFYVFVVTEREPDEDDLGPLYRMVANPEQVSKPHHCPMSNPRKQFSVTKTPVLKVAYGWMRAAWTHTPNNTTALAVGVSS